MSNPETSYQDVKAGSAAIAVDFHSQSESLVVAFGGMARTRDMPIFEFFHTASHMDTNTIFIRDLGHAWYHRGLPGIAENIDGVAAHLDGLIKSKPFKQITFVGSSTGGYAAILFGFLLQAHTVIAFVPKTFLSPWMRLLRLDLKTWSQMGALIWSRTAQRQYFDLRRVLQSRPTTTEFHVHYSTDGRVDILHAQRLRGIPNVHLHEHQDGGHKLVRKLRDAGKLREILLQSLHTKPAARTENQP